MNEKTLEELQDEFNSLSRKRMKQIIELEETTKELVGLAEKVYERSPEYVKVVCLSCNGKGTVDTEEGKKIRCQVCQGKCFMWVKRFQEVERANGS